MKRIRVEPISSYIERRRKGPIYPVVVANGFAFLSGLPPFDPRNRRDQTAPVRAASRNRDGADETMSGSGRLFARAGSQVQCLLYTSDPSHYARFNAVYDRYFSADPRHEFSCTCRPIPGLLISRSTALQRFDPRIAAELITEKPMSVYYIAEHIITDPAKFEEYRLKVAPMIAKLWRPLYYQGMAVINFPRRRTGNRSGSSSSNFQIWSASMPGTRRPSINR